VSYIDYDVAADQAKANEMIEKSGQTSTPVILIDDEMVIGFDQSKLDKMLSE